MKYFRFFATLVIHKREGEHHSAGIVAAYDTKDASQKVKNKIHNVKNTPFRVKS